MRPITPLLTLALLLAPAARAQPAPGEVVPHGTVEIAVLAPDGRPVAPGTPVTLERTDNGSRDGPTSARAQADDGGVIRVSWPAGIRRWRVAAPGVGYGYTGQIELLAGQTARAPLAPLAAYGRLTGVVDDALRAPGLTVRLNSSNAWAERVNATVAADGTFAAELPAGRWFATAYNGKAAVGQVAAAARVLPGGTTRDVRIAPMPAPAAPQPARVAMPGRGNLADRAKTVTWARGTVRDAAGRPIPAATVRAMATYHGGIRMYERLASATAGPDGRYELTGEGGLSAFSATLVAHAPGRPPAWAWVSSPDATPDDADKPGAQPKGPPDTDFVLADPPRAGAAAITILGDNGAPAENATVMLAPEDLHLREIWAAGSGSPERQVLSDLVNPVATTDRDGVARFAALVPGRYRVTAVAGGVDALRGLEGGASRFRSRAAHAFADGLPVRAAKTAAHTLALLPPAPPARFRVLRAADAAPLTGNQAMSYSSITDGGGWNSSTEFDPTGEGRLDGLAPGLHVIEVRYRNGPLKQIPLRDLPYHEARTVVAVSAALPAGAPPPTVRARGFAPGSVVVQVLDADGSPIKGATVEVTPAAGTAVACGTTAADGAVRFPGVPAWQYVAVAHAPPGGQPVTPTVDWAPDDAPLPDRAALAGQSAFLPVAVAPVPNAEQRIVLRRQAVGYVAGTLKLPAGAHANQFNLHVERATGAPDVPGISAGALRYQRSTGQFVAGPFQPGAVRLRAYYWPPDVPRAGAADDAGRLDVTVEAGKVTDAPWTVTVPAAAAPRTGTASMMLGVGGATARATGADVIAGRVFLADGTTPADAARVFYFEPARREPSIVGLADPTGAIRARGRWVSANARDMKNPPETTGPVAVAMLPGACGATTVDVAKAPRPLRFVLPPAISAGGRVTVGGAAPDGRAGRLRVLAAYDAAASVAAPLLAVQATARADGTFDLAGLTPGKYRVQAALDDVWLSATVAIDVAPDRPIAPIALDVPRPAGPVAVLVTDPKGAPLPGRTVTVDRPSGPLTDALWPKSFDTDGAGVAHIPALEAGSHTIRIPDAQPAPIDVPSTGPWPLRATLVLPPPTR